MRIVRVTTISIIFLLNLNAQENSFSEYIVLKNNEKTYGETKIKYSSSSQPYIQFKDSVKYNIEQMKIFKTKLGEYAIIEEGGFFSSEKIAKKILAGRISLYWIYNPKELHTYNETNIKYQHNNFFSTDSNTFYQLNYNNLNNYFLNELNKPLNDLSVYKRNNIISKSLYVTSFLIAGFGITKFFQKKEASPLYITLPISFALYQLSNHYTKKNVVKAVDTIYEFNSK